MNLILVATAALLLGASLIALPAVIIWRNPAATTSAASFDIVKMITDVFIAGDKDRPVLTDDSSMTHVSWTRRPRPDSEESDTVLAEFFDVDVSNASSYPEYEDIKHKPSVGMCFSGGGSRSFEVTLGYLRGLLDANLLRYVRYTSSVSGGSWANAVFTYHDESVVTLRELLGDWTPPERMTLNRMRYMSPKSARGFPVKADLIGNIAVELLVKKTSAEDIWVKAIHETFLKPAGIPFNAIPAWNSRDAARVLARNPHLLDNVEFRLPCSGRTPCEDVPFPIINMAMLGKFISFGIADYG